RLRSRFRSGLAIARGGGRRRRGFFLGCFLVTFTAVIGGVKAAALENDPRACADAAFDFPFAPGFPCTFIFRADGQRLLSNRLKNIELMLALGTSVFVSRHSVALINSGMERRQVDSEIVKLR